MPWLTGTQQSYAQLFVYLATLYPLAALFLFFYFIYIIRFKNNLATHKTSVVHPLLLLANRTIKFHYPGFLFLHLVNFLLARTSIFWTDSNLISYIYYRLYLIFTLLVNLFVQVYQLTIAALSVVRFIKSRKSGSRIPRKIVNILIRIFVLLVVLKDCGWYMYKLSLPWAWLVVKNEMSPFDLFDLLYTIHLMIFQLLIFIGMSFTYFTKLDPKISFSEKIILKQTKILGVAKLVMLILAGAGIFLEFKVDDVLMLICSNDFLLVPVVIMVTEVPRKVAPANQVEKKSVDTDLKS